ncbi:hypothetical protein O7628_14930 [Micromonospora sp. WMMD956]|uniref:hypothetical protein n=1 Tax=Micromonospora sp. WMMD956 TaxID=3016108 RepID=UPI002415E6D3|nr:hypothetical protein [Micromonospora sp. WMMD956]MDG4816788.1 hypothetical protein [Micromonospora sp. WMMD956]
MQAGLVDQSLFNTGFLDDTEFADFDAAAAQTRVPVLGFSVGQAFDYAGNHVALSVCAPIAVVESFVSPYRRHRSWLRWPGLLVVGALYLAGSLLIFADGEDGRKGFVLAPAQLVFAVLVVLALVAAALLPRWRRDRPAPVPGRRAAPAPLWVGILVYARRAALRRQFRLRRAELRAVVAAGGPAQRHRGQRHRGCPGRRRVPAATPRTAVRRIAGHSGCDTQTAASLEVAGRPSGLPHPP